MDLLYFFRLLQKQIRWMFIAGASLAIVVFLLTINLPREYESEAELNSGVSTSVNLGDIGPARLDFLTMNAKVDNIINTIKSRKTLDEVSTALLSYHLSLGTDPVERIISEKSMANLRDYFPEETLLKWRAEKDEIKRRAAIDLWKQENITSQEYFDVFLSETSHYGLRTLAKVGV